MYSSTDTVADSTQAIDQATPAANDAISDADMARLTNGADLVMAASFNAVALPEGFERLNARVLTSADWNGDYSFTNGGGRITEINGIRFDATGRKIDDDGGDQDFADAIEAHALETKREREREEWSRSMHSYAGLDMTGEEWTALSEKLTKGSPLQVRLVEQMKKDGESDESAQRLSELVRLKTAMKGLPKDQWTQEMKEADRVIQQDPTIAKKIERYTVRANNINQELAGPDTASRSGISDSMTTKVSADTRADLFASAPPLDEHYSAALAANVPLDNPKPAIAVAIAKPAPQPAVSAGFDV